MMKTKILPLALTAALLANTFTVFAGETETSSASSLIKPESYLIANALDYITLGSYTGLEAEKQIYTVSDEEAQMELEDRMYDYTYTENVTDRPAQTGDTLHVDLTLTIDGKKETMEDYEVDLGYEILGDEFDAKLLNASVGDTITFQDSFDEDDYMEDWAGKTIDFEVTVKSIGVLIIPDLTEEWVKENTDYETIDDYARSIKDELQANYDLQADEQVLSDLITAGAAQAQYSGYPQEAYDRLYDQTLESYQGMADMFGMTLEETLEAYEISEEDLADDTMEQMNRQLFLSAVALTEGITVTEDDVAAVAEKYYEESGYETAQAFMDDYGAEGLAPTALEAKIGRLLLETAVVTEVPYEDDSDMELEWEDESEYWDEDDEDWEEDDEDWDEGDEDWDEDDEDWDEDDVDWNEDDEADDYVEDDSIEWEDD